MTPVECTHKRLKTKMDFIGGVDVSVCCMFLVACNYVISNSSVKVRVLRLSKYVEDLIRTCRKFKLDYLSSLAMVKQWTMALQTMIKLYSPD